MPAAAERTSSCPGDLRQASPSRPRWPAGSRSGGRCPFSPPAPRVPTCRCGSRARCRRGAPPAPGSPSSAGPVRARPSSRRRRPCHRPRAGRDARSVHDRRENPPAQWFVPTRGRLRRPPAEPRSPARAAARRRRRRRRQPRRSHRARDLGTRRGYPWTGVAPVLRTADLATANLECAVSRSGAPAAGKEYTFRGEPGRSAGDRHGPGSTSSRSRTTTRSTTAASPRSTRSATRAAPGCDVGGGADLAAARRPVARELGGLRIAFSATPTSDRSASTRATDRPGAAPAFAELIDADVRRARRTADVVVVYFHWGTELRPLPDARQKRARRRRLPRGRDGRARRAPARAPAGAARRRKLVAWSLGNFVFSANSPGTTSTGVLLAHLGARGVVGQRLVPAKIRGVRPVPSTPSR